MARDRTHASLILHDHQGRALGQANWPMSPKLSIADFPYIESLNARHAGTSPDGVALR